MRQAGGAAVLLLLLVLAGASSAARDIRDVGDKCSTTGPARARCCAHKWATWDIDTSCLIGTPLEILIIDKLRVKPSGLADSSAGQPARPHRCLSA